MRGVQQFYPEINGNTERAAQTASYIYVLGQMGYTALQLLLEQGKIGVQEVLQQLPGAIRKKVVQKAKNYAVQQFTNAVFNRESRHQVAAPAPATPQVAQPARITETPIYDNNHRRPQPLDETKPTYGPEYKGIATVPPNTTSPGNHFTIYHGHNN